MFRLLCAPVHLLDDNRTNSLVTAFTSPHHSTRTTHIRPPPAQKAAIHVRTSLPHAQSHRPRCSGGSSSVSHPLFTSTKRFSERFCRRYWASSAPVLTQYGSTAAFQAIKADCSSIISTLRSRLFERLQAPHLSYPCILNTVQQTQALHP